MGKGKDLKPRKKTSRKWRKSIPNELIDYFDKQPFEFVQTKIIDEAGEMVDSGRVERVPAPIPSIRGFAQEIGICYVTIYDWINPESPRYKKELAKNLKVAKEIRKDIIVQGGLLGAYHHTFAKFVAVNMTDMVSDRSEKNLNLGGQKDNPIPPLTIILESNVDDTGK